MSKISKTELLKLVKSGDFTVAYHDNGCCEIHKGKFKDIDDITTDAVYSFDCDSDGYIPGEVDMLVRALGGSALSV